MLDWASYNGPDVGDVPRRGTMDQMGDRSTRVDRMHRGLTDESITHVAFLKNYNGRDASARIASQPSDRDPRSEIKAFL